MVTSKKANIKFIALKFASVKFISVRPRVDISLRTSDEVFDEKILTPNFKL